MRLRNYSLPECKQEEKNLKGEITLPRVFLEFDLDPLPITNLI